VPPPGVVVDHSPASTRTYVGSPSLAVLPDGTYVASHDLFGSGTTSDKTVVFASRDRGVTWSRLAEIDGQWWSTLFVHDRALYLIGTTRELGQVAIRRSNDGGRSWTTPDGPRTGLLTPNKGFHCAPTPVVEHAGRIWRAFEDTRGGSGTERWKAVVVSAPDKADLLDAKSWTFSHDVQGSTTWLDGKFANWLEGNVVVTPDGRLFDILRVNTKSNTEHAALVHVAPDGVATSFDPAADFVDFPGGSKKFTIRYDPRSKIYWTLADVLPRGYEGDHTDDVRNTLALVSSPDLAHWTERSVVLHHADLHKHGFQYADWQIDGDDLVVVVRTAFDDDTGGAHSFHDANYLTFHRIKDFRSAHGSR
jgi:hypothetical protein